jgi:hypothetical protein
MRFDTTGLNAIMDRFSSPSGGMSRDETQSPPPSLPSQFGGTPSISISGAGMGSGSGSGSALLGDTQTQQQGGGEAAARLNENLRNIGRFFKRDLGGLGGLGGRFGGAGGAAGGSQGTSPAPPENRA